MEDIRKFNNDHWLIAKVVSKNSNLIELSIINSDKVIYLNEVDNFYGPDKVPPSDYLNINDYIFLLI